MQQLVASQRSFFESHQTKDLSFRKKQLKALHRSIKNNEQLLYDAIYSDFKKSEFETYATELALVYHDIKVALRNLESWSRPKRVGTNLVNFPAKSYIITEPLGVSLIIGTWNYPYLLTLGPVVGAIAAGCTVILKPSELPKKTSAALKKIIADNFDASYLTVVEGGKEETTKLLEQKFDKIFFTGSTEVGKIIYKAAAEQLTPVTLELGGKSPAIVTADCDLKMTVKRIVWGKFLNAGQTCIAPDYIVVDKQIENKFLEMCVEEITKRRYEIENGNYVEIINDSNFERLVSLIDKDKVFFGGEFDKSKRLIRPTIMTSVTAEDAVMQEEVFGPILPILTYDSIDDAIQTIKNYSRPLACYVFTRSKSLRRKVLGEISFGGGGVNETVMQITNPNLPFGGVGHSGISAYHGKVGFDAFSHFKSIIQKPFWFELSLKYAPYSTKKLRWIKKVFKL